MIKKTLIMAGMLVFAASVAVYAEQQNVTTPATTPSMATSAHSDFKKPPKGPDFAKRNAEFEKRLQLTEKQKIKAEKIREQGFEKMKPIMDKLKEKRAEADAVRRSRIAEQEQKVRLEQLHKEIVALQREAHEIRMQNMKDFESILTKKQKNELKKMKEEGRKKYDQEHRRHPHPPFGQGFGPQGPQQLSSPDSEK